MIKVADWSDLGWAVVAELADVMMKKDWRRQKSFYYIWLCKFSADLQFYKGGVITKHQTHLSVNSRQTMSEVLKTTPKYL